MSRYLFQILQHLAELMAGAGFTSVFDVTEGMIGSSAGPGWIDAGLPVAAYSDLVTD